MKSPRRGDIYFADMRPAIGSEQTGRRPVLIIQNDIGNEYSQTTIVASLTSTEKIKCLPTHVKLPLGILKAESTIMLEQLRTIDKRRLLEYRGTLDSETMEIVDRALSVSLSLMSSWPTKIKTKNFTEAVAF